MGYADVKKYAEVYNLQHMYADLQREAVHRIIDSYGDSKVDKDSNAIALRYMSVARSLQGLEQVGKSLDKRYQGF